MRKPREQISEDDVIIRQQNKDLAKTRRESRSGDAHEAAGDPGKTGGTGEAEKPSRKNPGERGLFEVADKAKRAPRDG